MPDNPLVVCAADDRYAVPLTVMLCSMGDHLGADRTATVWVMDGGISRRNKRRIVNSLPDNRIQIHWMAVDAGLLADMPVFGHVSLSTYYRFLLGSILPADVEKIIYLDVDIIVLGDIAELWSTPLGNHALLAVPERNSKAGDMLDPAILTGVGLTPERGCFNAGVMLIHLDRWRTANLLDRARTFVNQYGSLIRYWDQDILNCLLANEWGVLDGKWNQKVDHVDKDNEGCLIAYQKSGGLIHFASAIKPWTWWADHQAKSLYFSWVDRTAWRGTRPRAPLRCTIGNRHWYGKWVRGLPVIGRLWMALMNWRKRVSNQSCKEE